MFALFCLLFYIFYRYLTDKPHPKFPPGPLRWPIWGAYLQLLVENYRFPYKAMHWMARRYKTEVLGMYLGPFPTVVACSSASVRELLIRPEFQGRVEGFIPQIRDDDGVIRGQFFIDGSPWTEQRRFMLRYLRDFGWGTRSKSFEKIVEEEVRDFLDLVQSKVEGVSDERGVLVPSAFYTFFLNLTMQLLLGCRFPPPLHHKLREFAFTALRFQLRIDPTTGMINLTPWVRHIAPRLSGFIDCVRSNRLIKQFIQEHVQHHKDTYLPEALRDFCDVYLKQMKEKQESGTQHWFSEQQLVMMCWDLLFPTSMTVTATMGFAVEFLLLNPEVQPKIQEEIDRVIGRSRLPNLDDRKLMPYTEAVLREVMRAEALVPLALPHRCTQDTYFYGHFIPKDTMMLANIWSSNMDDKIWDKPFEFSPERHLDANGQLKKKDLSLPFGLGKRVCSAETFARQNLFLLFSAMMQHFTLLLPCDQPPPDPNLHLPGINISPPQFRVLMVPR
ncbi:probable cytochrome P450 304a1 [Macrosteles quadrilineatus]|uniref:probable cytochrome P450 304a1 n=1 Tax=Macrosteles quadrilineatus TaxID=74068 RepID=UPI0023E2DB12|nr:probable cytochrome P450 304a1 [Macrosteles quadrilineatus]